MYDSRSSAVGASIAWDTRSHRRAPSEIAQRPAQPSRREGPGLNKQARLGAGRGELPQLLPVPIGESLVGRVQARASSLTS